MSVSVFVFQSLSVSVCLLTHSCAAGVPERRGGGRPRVPSQGVEEGDAGVSGEEDGRPRHHHTHQALQEEEASVIGIVAMALTHIYTDSLAGIGKDARHKWVNACLNTVLS